MCLNRFHYRWLHFQLCECSCTVRQRLCGKLLNAHLCPDGQGVKQRSIMPSQPAMPGIPITIFYRLVYEPRTTMLYSKSYHHPKENTIFCKWWLTSRAMPPMHDSNPLGLREPSSTYHCFPIREMLGQNRDSMKGGVKKKAPKGRQQHQSQRIYLYLCLATWQAALHCFTFIKLGHIHCVCTMTVVPNCRISTSINGHLYVGACIEIERLK